MEPAKGNEVWPWAWFLERPVRSLDERMQELAVGDVRTNYEWGKVGQQFFLLTSFDGHTWLTWHLQAPQLAIVYLETGLFRKGRSDTP